MSSAAFYSQQKNTIPRCQYRSGFDQPPLRLIFTSPESLFTSPESVFTSVRNPYSHRCGINIHIVRNTHHNRYQGSRVIFRVRFSVRPNHLSGHKFDHDYYFAVTWKLLDVIVWSEGGRPFVPSDVPYEAERRGNGPFWNPRTMYPALFGVASEP